MIKTYAMLLDFVKVVVEPIKIIDAKFQNIGRHTTIKSDPL